MPSYEKVPFTPAKTQAKTARILGRESESITEINKKELRSENRIICLATENTDGGFVDLATDYTEK